MRGSCRMILLHLFPLPLYCWYAAVHWPLVSRDLNIFNNNMNCYVITIITMILMCVFDVMNTRIFMHLLWLETIMLVSMMITVMRAYLSRMERKT